MFEDMSLAWERAAARPVPLGVPADLSTPVALLTDTGQASVHAELGMDADAVRVAGLVERAQSRWDGMLFTATPTQDLDAVTACQHLQNQAFALMLRTLVATSNRASGDERCWVADEVALAIGASTATGDALLHLATSACELPGLVEAVEANLLTERHVRAVLRVVDDPALDLSLEHRQAVIAIMLTRFTGQTPTELTAMLRRLVLQIDLYAAQRRQDNATARRDVRAWEHPNGQAGLQLTGPKPQISAVLSALARQDSLQTREPSDERTRDNRLFDLAVALLTGGAEASGGWDATIVIPYSTATGGDLELAEIPGLGPVLPSTARDLLEGALRHRRLAVDAEGDVIAVDDATPTPVTPAPAALVPTSSPDVDTTGPAAGPTSPVSPTDAPAAALRHLAGKPVSVTDLSTHRYRIPGRLARHLETRDRTCVFPGCTRPASLTDKDHRIPWPLGATDLRNLQCLCRRHHRAKQAAFDVVLLPDGSYRWTSRRTGHQHERPPKGW